MTATTSPTGGGFYAGNFLPGELEDLKKAMESSLAGEIDMLRVLIRRVFSSLVDEAGDLKGWVGALSALSSASQRLAVLLRMEQSLGEGRADAAGALSQALKEVLNEMGAE